MTKRASAFLLAIILAGCVSYAPLGPRPAGNPLHADLSGQWVLRGELAPRTSGEQTIRIPPPAGVRGQTREGPRSRKSRGRGSALHVFLQFGNAIKVTQTEYSLFFSFDRAIVEEYNFGENRKVNVGPIEAQRVSGWDGRTYIAETMDADGYVLTETWRLDDGGELLIRGISIARDDKLEQSSEQVFERR